MTISKVKTIFGFCIFSILQFLSVDSTLFAATYTVNFDNYISSTDNDYSNNFIESTVGVFTPVTTGGIVGGAIEPANTGSYGNDLATYRVSSSIPAGKMMKVSLNFQYKSSLVNPNSNETICLIWFKPNNSLNHDIVFRIQHDKILNIITYNWIASNDDISPALMLTDGWYRLEAQITNIGGQFEDQLHVYTEVFNLGSTGTENPVSVGVVQGTIYDYNFASADQISASINATKWGGANLLDNFVFEAPSSIIFPTANAGLDQVVFDTVTLDGSGSIDPDGTILSYQWTLNHRENSDFNRTATGAVATIANLSPGFYDVTLEVTDNSGGSGTSKRLLAVAGPWDMNSDGKLGLAEVIHILQIVGGTK